MYFARRVRRSTRCPLSRRAEARLEGKAQIGAVQCDGGERRALHRGGQAAPHDLDFG